MHILRPIKQNTLIEHTQIVMQQNTLIERTQEIVIM